MSDYLNSHRSRRKEKRMKSKRIYTTFVLIAFGLLIIPLTSTLVLALAEEDSVKENSAERYVFGITPRRMQGVAMSYLDPLHELHVNAMEKEGKDCTVCHFDNDETRFMGVSPNDEEMLDIKTRIHFVHSSCATCHTQMLSAQRKDYCRTCHITDGTRGGGKQQKSGRHQKSRQSKRYHKNGYN